MKYLAGISLFIIFCPMIFIGQSFHIENYQWGIMPVDESITGRHENAFIEYKDRFYLMGGRGINPVDVYDPVNNIWSNNGKTPLEIHHFQPVVANNLIYLVGAMTGNYPRETPLETILIYDPESDQWSTGDTIPKSRRRGAGGVIFHDQWIYFIGGIQYGHISGTCAWADAYNIETGEWKILPDAPNARDHFFAVFHDDKIYCVGGRNTSYHEPDNFTAFFGATITAVDCYNIKTGKWQTLADSLPIGTAGAPTVLLQDKIIVAGGESNQQLAHNETQVLDLNTLSWSLQNPMVVGRHGTMAVTWENKIYTGSRKR
jgi:N-acetylneuraminic acid mutarotase